MREIEVEVEVEVEREMRRGRVRDDEREEREEKEREQEKQRIMQICNHCIFADPTFFELTISLRFFLVIFVAYELFLD